MNQILQSSNIFNLKTNDQKYFPGETIIGSINLLPGFTQSSFSLKIEVKSVEKTFLLPIDKLSKKDQKEIKKQYTQRKVNFYSTTTRQFDRSFNAKAENNSNIAFQINLDQNLPPSFIHHCSNYNYFFQASIRHKIIATILDSKGEPIAKDKLGFAVASKTSDPNYPLFKKTGHDFKIFGNVFSDKNITLSLQIDQQSLDLDTNNLVHIEIDALEAKSSLIDVKLQLINYFFLKNNGKTMVCRNLATEILIANKLPKQIDYSGQKGFLLVIPAEITSMLQQSINSSNIINIYALRLSVDKNNGTSIFKFSDKSCDVVLPVHFIRTSKDYQLNYNTSCICPMGIKKFNLQRIDEVIFDKIEKDRKLKNSLEVGISKSVPKTERRATENMNLEQGSRQEGSVKARAVDDKSGKQLLRKNTGGVEPIFAKTHHF